MGALIYAVRRLPTEITRARRVILGQSARGFQAALGVDVGGWERVKAPARRRPWYHDGRGTLAVLLASQSDIDDLVPTLVAFQIEWNKLHRVARDVGADAERDRLETGQTPASRDNWLYFAARALFDRHPRAADFRRLRTELEREVGIVHVMPPAMGIDSAAQVVRLAGLDPACLDPRVGEVDGEALRRSRAALVNVDYPLGLAAYHILRQAAEASSWMLGVYVMGKAATLNADVGDMMIPNVVFNEHSGNTYWLDNCFTAADVQPHLVFGSVLDNQRAVTVRGTFLQNRDYLEFYYQGRYTVVEMEAGTYL